MQEGGVPRQGYFLGKLVKKIKDDIIPNELKTGVGKAATAAALTYGLDRFGVPFTSRVSKSGENIGKGSISNIFKSLGIGGGNQGVTADAEPVRSGIGSIFRSPRAAGAESVGIDPRTGLPIPTNEKGFLGKTVDFFTKDRLGTDKSFADLLMTPQALAIGSGLLAGAFTKDEEDPLYTGQDVGLNLADIGKLANISDPKTASAIGLRFSPDVEARKFTPAEMAATYAANAPADFTQEREPAQDGGIMGDQKDFEQFLQDKMNMDKSMLQDKILEDFKKYMERKRMIENLPEAKNGGLMKMAEGGMMDMGGMEMDLRGGGFVPMGRAEKADDVPARLSKNEFVFTADAVRAAGGGDVDKGADKMYATMKKLEDRVA